MPKPTLLSLANQQGQSPATAASTSETTLRASTTTASNLSSDRTVKASGKSESFSSAVKPVTQEKVLSQQQGGTNEQPTNSTVSIS